MSPDGTSVIGQVGITGIFAKDFYKLMGMPLRYGMARWSHGISVILLRSPKRAA